MFENLSGFASCWAFPYLGWFSGLQARSIQETKKQQTKKSIQLLVALLLMVFAVLLGLGIL